MEEYYFLMMSLLVNIHYPYKRIYEISYYKNNCIIISLTSTIQNNPLFVRVDESDEYSDLKNQITLPHNKNFS